MDWSNFTYNISQSFSYGSVNYDGFSSFSGAFAKIITVIFDLIGGIYDAFTALVSGLNEISTQLSNMIYGLTNGQTAGFPILEGVGAYRWIVGDFVFYMTYLIIAFSLMLSIWHIVHVIYQRISGYYGAGRLTSFSGKFFNYTGQ